MKMRNTPENNGPMTSVASLFVAALMALVAAPTQIEAAVVTLNPTGDTNVTASFVGSSNNYNNLGGSALLGASIYAGDAAYGEYSLLRFNVSGTIPGGATINSVTLKMTAAYSYSYSFSEVLKFWQVDPDNAGWVEGTGPGTDPRLGATGRWLNQTSYTNDSVNSGTAWASSGLFARAAGDLGSQVGSQGFASITAGTTYSFTLATSMVDGWLSDSNAENAGVAFHLTNSEAPPAASRFMYFHSMESGQSSGLLPQLVIDYTPVPEPTVAGLLGLGGLLWLSRRVRRRA